jgi:hypothetical protein
MLMRLIDGDALIKILEPHSLRNGAALGWHNGIIDAVIDEIRKMPTIGGWISVKDRPPKIGDTVLFTGLSSFDTRFIPQRGWFDGTFWKRDAGETVYTSTPVTHWMPLPSTEGLDGT